MWPRPCRVVRTATLIRSRRSVAPRARAPAARSRLQAMAAQAREPPVPEADGSTGTGHHRSSTHRDLEAIVHQRLHIEKVTLGTLTGNADWSHSQFRSIRSG